jgi:glyoxylase-like metal-dependent hydrolase (beta-lactamase superfamily II)
MLHVRRAIGTVTALLVAVTCATESRGSAQAPSSVRLYVLDGGILESDPARYRLTARDVETTELSVAAYLIVHPKGTLLWDAGAVPDADWTPTGKPVRHQLVLPNKQERVVTLRMPLGQQLASSGFSPEKVTHLALSHYHWDHTANANAFAAATWLVPQAERDEMFAETPFGNARPATYASLRNSRTVVLTSEEHDVFGDGRVIIKRAAGHTPGHQVVFVRLDRTGGVVLSGDLYHYAEERTLGRLPTFEFNEEQTRVARQSVDAFLKRQRAQLWIQHDLPAHAKLRKAPAYYD